MKAVLTLVRCRWLVGSLLLTLSPQVDATFAAPQPTPVDRLLKSADAYLARHPESAEAHYTLGRIHYLAFHLKADQVPAFGYRVAKDEPPYLAPQWMLSWNHGKGPANELPAKALVSHAAQAMHHFNEAIRLKNYEEPGLIYLGVASLEEEFLDWDEKANTTDLPPELTGITLTKIRADYAQALTVAMAKDSLLNTLPVSGRDGITSYEAASALVRLAEKPGTALTDAERKEIEKAKNALKHFASVKMGPITPMVFSFQAVDHLDALLAPETTVDFDLRGYGPRERWPWVRPDLGLLVWDPQHTGRIESARQLFGGYTFEIFRATGYDALAALDDNGDGVLSGAELDGICVWFDRNGDGVSTPDEVTPLRDLGVVSVAVTMDGYDGIHPTNGCGITLRDGRTLRTWDWMVKPLSSITPPLASAR